jgi:surfactin synthase thioesterase subunit
MANPWLLREPSDDVRARVFCLPVSGLGATTFRRWPGRIDGIEVCPVQLPGRENRMREPSYTDMDAFAADAASALEPYLDRPYAFFGHCLGGRLGYALTLELMNRDVEPPQRLTVSSCLAPHEGGGFGPYRPEMSDVEYGDELRRGCRSRQDPEPYPEIVTMVVNVLRADVNLSCGYVPSGPVGKPLAITTIGWTTDRDVRPEEMALWDRYGERRAVVLDGDEFSFMGGPESLCRVLAEDLAVHR